MTQTQLLQTTAQSVLNNPQETPPVDKCGEFLMGRPLTFSHASDPLEADDWLKAMERQLNIAHCDDQEKVLFASGQLQGAAQDWWETYQNGCPNNAGQITWQEFMENFKTYHIPAGEVELKQDEFQALNQGSISMCEYRNWFTQLSHLLQERQIVMLRNRNAF